MHMYEEYGMRKKFDLIFTDRPDFAREGEAGGTLAGAERRGPPRRRRLRLHGHQRSRQARQGGDHRGGQMYVWSTELFEKNIYLVDSQSTI